MSGNIRSILEEQIDEFVGAMFHTIYSARESLNHTFKAVVDSVDGNPEPGDMSGAFGVKRWHLLSFSLHISRKSRLFPFLCFEASTQPSCFHHAWNVGMTDYQSLETLQQSSKEHGIHTANNNANGASIANSNANQHDMSSNINDSTYNFQDYEALPLHKHPWRLADFGHVQDRQFSQDGSIHVTDEVFNAASHLAALVLSILGSVLLIAQASAQGAPWKIVSFSIYGLSLVTLFGASTLHHAIRSTRRLEEFLQMLDYLAIFPLIAGTLTPLCLVYLHDSVVGWTFLGTLWILCGVCMWILARHFAKIPQWATMTLYLTFGWMGALLAIGWLTTTSSSSASSPYLPWRGMTWLVVGGCLYTLGGIVYVSERPNPWPGRFGFHEIWHVAVMLAAACHWILMYRYVLPFERTE